jgi:hypothetical protein
LPEVLESRNNIYMVMELCTGGELFDKIGMGCAAISTESRFLIEDEQSAHQDSASRKRKAESISSN